jgi:hypothetical protein
MLAHMSLRLGFGRLYLRGLGLWGFLGGLMSDRLWWSLRTIYFHGLPLR